MLKFLFLLIFISFSLQSPLIPNSLTSSLNPFYFSPQNGRIVGGEETDITVVPYMASLRFAGVHSCGCVILSTTYVITAAHCTVSWQFFNNKWDAIYFFMTQSSHVHLIMQAFSAFWFYKPKFSHNSLN